MGNGFQAADAVRPPSETAADEEKHALANQWTQRGISLLSSPVSSDLIEALGCFDEAIHLRQGLLLEVNPWYRWGLTAGWMNRADVLSRLGRAQEALAAYGRALEHLQKLPLEMEPAFRWRLGLAWMNRALTLHDLGPAHDEAALASLDTSIEVLSHPALTTPRDLGTLGCAWMNRAALLMQTQPVRPAEALEAALKALPSLVPLERSDLVAADAALKARHRSCQAIAMLLETPPVPVDKADDWIMTATDHVEEGLALAEHWQGRADFTEITLQLFRFGCRIYLAFQPHFLGEFMLDVLRPRPDRVISRDFHIAAEEAIQHAAEILRQRGPTDLGLRRVDDLLLVLEGLEAAAQQIRTWRPAETTPA
ncbi:hypothetical protein [Brevifollis gellanilyticus]|uniref:Tetratricopeptide repeat protein n=1 Tax=Brevifollis gellanilyticus TaxID=748831 RepID=A0A512MIS6_9BACT|nr:hypothetical protein [Brevifollis gellanilyticus]GEP46211.1 hypothetical protein BGE01nite_55020 [Brevifollis gellanilyticus]